MHHPPILTLEQRRAALAKAAESRRARALFKEEIKSGKRSWIEALDHPAEAIQRMRLTELIGALPGFGEVRAAAVLDRAGISHSRRVQGLGSAQRASLLEILRGRV
jgi:hypothetical protein